MKLVSSARTGRSRNERVAHLREQPLHEHLVEAFLCDIGLASVSSDQSGALDKSKPKRTQENEFPYRHKVVSRAPVTQI